MSAARGRPASVSAAAALFAVYGIAAVVNAIIAQSWTGWVEAASLPRALLRLAGGLLVAWGLLQATEWAWWLGLALAVLWLVGGLTPVLVMERGDVHWLPPSAGQLFLALSLVSLLIAILLLLTPSARAFLRRTRR